jgi:hypothetical protein
LEDPPNVNDLNITLLNSLHQALVQGVVYRVQVEVWVMKDLLNEHFELLLVPEPFCGTIKKKTLTP